MGFPIRKSLDQSPFAAPQGLSQRTTSFIASQHQGIHRIPLRHLIALIIHAHPSAEVEATNSRYLLHQAQPPSIDHTECQVPVTEPGLFAGLDVRPRPACFNPILKIVSRPRTRRSRQRLRSSTTIIRYGQKRRPSRRSMPCSINRRPNDPDVPNLQTRRPTSDKSPSPNTRSATG